MKLRGLFRLAAMGLAGGGLFQLGGCIDSLAPTALALGEQILLSQFLGSLPIF
jgi:hypothetical protein